MKTVALCQWLLAIKINSHIAAYQCVRIRVLGTTIFKVFHVCELHVRLVAKPTTPPTTVLRLPEQKAAAVTRSSSNTQQQCAASKHVSRRFDGPCAPWSL